MIKLNQIGKPFLIAGFAFGFMSASVQAQAVKAEPYQWKSVTILANGFINGVVYGRAPDGPCYINTDMGGAYRLDAANNEWVCLTDWIKHDDWSLNQMGVETLAVDPSDANRVYIAIGTYMGASAVVRSDDQGRTLQRTNVPFPMNGNGLGRNSGERMNVDPNLGSRLLYGTRNRGLYESDDYAASWHAVNDFPTLGDKTPPGKDIGLTWTLFDKASGSTGQPTPVAYVGVCTLKPNKIFRTTDAGKAWQPIPNQPGGALLPTRAAITPDGKTLYATFVTAKEAPGPFGVDGGAVYRCDDPAGVSPKWTDISPTKGSGGWSGVTLDLQSPGTVYVSSLDHYAAPGDDIFRTRDGGKTWTPLHIRDHRDDRSAPYVKDIGLHWTGDVEVNPHDDNDAMFTTGYGLYRTTDLKSDAPTWVFYNKGFEQSAVTELISPREGSANLISAIGDRDGYRHEDFSVSPKYGRLGQKNDFGQTVNRSMGTCNDIDVAWNDSNIVVRVGAGAQYSNDGGITWDVLGGGSARNYFDEAASGGSRGPRGGSISISPDGNTTVWAPERSHALVAHRDGKTWGKWSNVNGLPTGNLMMAADYVNAGTFYARGRDAIYISTNGGQSFTKQPGACPAGAMWMRSTPGHAGDLWLTAGDEGNGGLNHSTDGGKTWTRVAPSELTVAKEVGIGAPPPGKNYPAIFAGGTCGDARGFFRSDDEGATWIRINDDAHQYGNVTVINGDSRVFGRLYVGTNGRGILYGDLVQRAQ